MSPLNEKRNTYFISEKKRYWSLFQEAIFTDEEAKYGPESLFSYGVGISNRIFNLYLDLLNIQHMDVGITSRQSRECIDTESGKQILSSVQ